MWHVLGMETAAGVAFYRLLAYSWSWWAQCCWMWRIHTACQASRQSIKGIIDANPYCPIYSSGGPAQVLPPDFKLMITIPDDSSAQRSATIRTIGNSQERLRHARTQGVATDSTAAHSRMDMRRATRAMSRYHWVHARDQLNQQHRSETARRGPGPLLPTKRTASVQQEVQTKPLAKRRRPEVLYPCTSIGISMNELCVRSCVCVCVCMCVCVIVCVCMCVCMCVCVCVCVCVCQLVRLVGTLMPDSVGPVANGLGCLKVYCCTYHLCWFQGSYTFYLKYTYLLTMDCFWLD